MTEQNENLSYGVKEEKAVSYWSGIRTGFLSGLIGTAIVFAAIFVPSNYELRDVNKDGRDDLLEYNLVGGISVEVNTYKGFRYMNHYHNEKEFQEKLDSDLKTFQLKLDSEERLKDAEARRKVQEMIEKGLIAKPKN